MRALPDGRFAASLLDRHNVWRGGRLAVFERQFGPEVPAGAEAQAAVGAYKRAFTVLDGSAAAGGLSPGGFYRHPVPLPDGRILVSHAPGPIDLDAAESAPELGLYVAILREDRASGRPVLAALDPLLDEPGVAERDAEPIVARPLEDDPTHLPAWDPARTRTTGTLALRHVETVEAILTNLSQAGAKALRPDIVYARFIEAVPVTPNDLAVGPIAMGTHGRARILAEVPLAGGSLLAEVPADVPFRIQLLDRERMAVGAQHDRWLHVAPGETFPSGVSRALYPSLCAGCHGALSGRREDVGGPVPDVITAASTTLATHENFNPNRPLPPVRLGDAPTTVDFRRDVWPILARSCASATCHSGAAPAGALDLVPTPTARFDTAYEALLAPGEGSGGGRKYVDEASSSAHTSYLIERIYGRELGAPRALSGTCPGEPPLSAADKLTLVRWIDLGAPYRGGSP
jgi:hypothetical protein